MTTSARAVQFDRNGDVDVLEVRDVELPDPGPEEVLLEVRAASINPGEIAIREGAFGESTFPSGQGSDVAGVVTAVGGPDTGFAVGDEVLGYSWNRDSQASAVVVPAEYLVAKPVGVSWPAAGSLYVAGATAIAAVRAIDVHEGDTVVVSAAAGGVGSFVIQLLKRAGARVIGIASTDNHEWLRGHGVEPIAYDDGLLDAIRAAAPDGVDAFIDLFGPTYVDLALALDVAPERIDTIISFERAEQVGAKTEGSMAASDQATLTELAGLVDSGELDVEIAATYPLEDVREAVTRLAERHTRGKIVLVP